MMREDVAMGVMSELEHVVRAGWSVRREEDWLVVVAGEGEEGVDFVSEVWRIARFVAYAEYVAIERVGAGEVRISSRSGDGLSFEVRVRGR